MSRKRNEAHVPAEKFATLLKRENLPLGVTLGSEESHNCHKSSIFSLGSRVWLEADVVIPRGVGTCHVGIERLYQFLLLGHRLLVRVITSV